MRNSQPSEWFFRRQCGGSSLAVDLLGRQRIDRGRQVRVLDALFLLPAPLRRQRIVAAWIALIRHFAQTDADRQRRITESFSKAAEQLGSEKIEERTGGIYTLERLAREAMASPQGADADPYWTVIETLTAVRHDGAKRRL
jgi:hypothetical protein